MEWDDKAPVEILEAMLGAGARVLARMRDAEDRLYELENRGTCGACGTHHVKLTPHDGLLRCWPCRNEWEAAGAHDGRTGPFKCARCGASDWKKVKTCGEYFCPGCRPRGSAPRQEGRWIHSRGGEWECACPFERIQKPGTDRCDVCTARRPPGITFGTWSPSESGNRWACSCPGEAAQNLETVASCLHCGVSAPLDPAPHAAPD